MKKSNFLTEAQLIAKGLVPGQKRRRATNSNSFNASGLMDAINLGRSINKSLLGNEYGMAGNIFDAIRGRGPRRLGGVSRETVTNSGESRSAERKTSAVGDTSSIISRPVVSGTLEQNSGRRIKIGAAPSVRGEVGPGMRLVVTFMGPSLGKAKSTSGISPAAAWIMPKGEGTLDNLTFQYLQLNPGEEKYSWGVTSTGGTSQCDFAPLFYCVPKLACLARCFTRYHIARVAVRTIAKLGSQTDGTFTIGYVPDIGKPLEVGQVDGSGDPGGETYFRWVADLEKASRAPLWTAETEHVLINCPTPPTEDGLQYIMEGYSAQAEAPIDLLTADLRFNSPGVLCAAQDVGLSADANPVVLRRTIFTVTLDLYGLAVGSPLYGNVRAPAPSLSEARLPCRLVIGGKQSLRRATPLAQESKQSDSNPHDEWSVVSGPKSASIEMKDLTGLRSRVDAGKTSLQATPRSLSLK